MPAHAALRYLVGLSLLVSTAIPAAPATGPARLGVGYLKTRPKLLVALVIDQFRADYLTRFHDCFRPPRDAKKKTWGGFRYLTDLGAWYPNGQYGILQNMTGPGHATILSGSFPASNGIALNDWQDRATGKMVYCAEDAAFGWIGGGGGDHAGGSPKNFIGSTVGDELKAVSRSSRVVSLALKDRAAIFMGGHGADAALWMDPGRFQWTSTKYYFPDGELPAWVRDANTDLAKRREQVITQFDFLPKLATLAPGAEGLVPQGLRWGDKAAAATPAGLEITEELAERAVDAMKLGAGKAPDVLAVSLSSHDYAGHALGPEHPALEAMTVAEDQTLSRFFNFLEKRVPGGMKNVLVVLTADHGVAPTPEAAKARKLPAGRVDEDALKKRLETRLADRFGDVKHGWVSRVSEMNVFLDAKAIADRKVERAAVEEEARREVAATPGVATAFTGTDYAARRLPAGLTGKQALNTYFPGRSGDVVGILAPFFISGDIAANHQTGYSYDRTVPIVFAGPHVVSGVFAQEAQTVDIAPTIAFLLGTVAPSNSEGRVLSEMLGP